MSMEDVIINSLKAIYGALRFVAFLPRNLKVITRIPSRESFYPEYKRKPKGTILHENLNYLFRYHEVNPYYISYGFDVEEFRNQDDFLAHSEFVVKRNLGNQVITRTPTGDYNYMVLLRDKYLFANYLASAIGEETVIPTYALILGEKVFINDEKRWIGIDEALEADGEKVFKVLDGECADGVMLVEVKAGKVYVDGEYRDKEKFIASISSKKVIVQDVIQQHEALKCFKTKSVNTIRVVTVQGKSGEIGLFSAFLRISGNDTSFVDNRAKGGLGIGVDIETGKLLKYAYPHDGYGKKKEMHELSKIVYEGYQLPDWGKVTDLVIAAHRQFYEFQSIGWDVVLTPNGPRLLEGNDDWEIGGPQDTSGGLRERWIALVNG